MMFSVGFESIDEYPAAANLREAYVPLFWIEEGITLGKPYINLLKYQLYL